MTDFIAWKPPAGEVVDPPVANWREVDALFSDRSEQRAKAGDLNWSGEGDGPKIIAYSVVEEYVEPVKAVRDGETPLDANLGHRLLDVFNEGILARDSGAASPYTGHSLEHCLHAAGWVQRDLRLALDKQLSAPLDLTKITTPFGLLDEVYGPGTQAALKAHGGPYELWRGGLWGQVCNEDLFDGWYAYRVAPSAAPAKPAPREVVAWAVVRGDGEFGGTFRIESLAHDYAQNTGGTVVKLTGVMP